MGLNSFKKIFSVKSTIKLIFYVGQVDPFVMHVILYLLSILIFP